MSRNRRRKSGKDWVEGNEDNTLLKLHRAQRLLREERESKKRLLADLELARERVSIALAITETVTPRPIKERSRAKNKREATPVICASDWHIEERVAAENINGLNEYNLEVSQARSRRFFEGACWLIQHHQRSFLIRDAVLWLGGDLITGVIHEELLETNELSPVEAVLRCQRYLSEGIQTLLDRTGLKRLLIPCNYGNHGRTTAKRRYKSGAANSYEWMMYHQLAKQFASDKRVEFVIADGSHLYLDVYSFRLRFLHGDDCKFGGGIGGLSIPVSKAVMRWNKIKPAHYTIMGHFHTLCDFGQPSVVINGSLIGPSAYSLSLGYAERPKQAFFLVDKHRGKCQSTPIWVED